GLIYCLTHAASLWSEPVLLDQAEQSIGFLNESIEEDRHFDILAGAAGYLCVLESFYRSRPSPAALEGITRCADHLVRNAEQMTRGKAWPLFGGMASAPLTGFSHGASGISYSLLMAFARTGDERYRETALDAIEYERSQFVSSEGNWRDLRTLPNTADIDDRFMVAWCHGAPGIGLARMHAMPFIDEPQL